ncbi:MAG TPA: PKD domain-containing protein [Candidatus Binatia bacterium]|jgi:hypothetical protein
MTRLLILTALLCALNAQPPFAIWTTSNNAMADTASDRAPSKQQLQTPQRLPRPDIAQQRLQQKLPAEQKTQTDSPLRQQLQTPQRLLRPDVFLQRRQQTDPAAPKAEITPQRQVVTQGQPAIFDSKSVADPDMPITVYQWSGPDGQTSNRQRFVVDTTNLKPSTYPLTLIVIDRQQRQGRGHATLVVEARPHVESRPPVARINRAILEVQQGEPARFSSTSYHPDRTGKITHSSWQTSWGQKASGDYIDIDTSRLNARSYTLTLEVIDNRGARDSARATLVVTPAPALPPVARISPDGSRVNEGMPVRFFNKSHHPDGKRKIISAQWQTSWGQRASGDYIDIDTSRLKPGEHSVSLRVVDDNHAADSAKAILIVEDPKALMPPVAIITPDQRRVYQGAPVDFADASYHPIRETRIVSRRWNTQWGQTDLGNTLNVDTASLSPGTYWITLQVVDQHKKADSARAVLEILQPVQPQQPPIARITPKRIEVQRREPVRFDGSGSSDADGKIRTWTWSLNDRPIDRKPAANIDTRGLSPGEYRVRLEVTDEQGLTARDEALLVIIVPPRDVDAAIVQLDVLPAPVMPNRQVEIRAMVANRGKDALRNVPVRFEIGGVRIAEKTLPSLAAGETKEVTVSWIPKFTGERFVIATVNPDNQPPESNRTNNATQRAILVFTEPVIKIAPSPLEVRQGDMAKFTGVVTIPGRPAGRDITYFWRGPGNRTGHGAEFQFDTHELSQGDYKIVLEISDSSGFKATANTTLKVLGAKPQVWLTADTQSPEAGGDVRFNAGTRPDLSQVQYKFLFGDGEETEWDVRAQAVHRYAKSGDYTARLLARRTGMDLGETFIGISVKHTAYAVSLRTETESVSAGDPLAFIANIEPSADDVEYLFRFGDGQESGWTRSPAATHSYSGNGDFEATVEARIRGAQAVRSPVIHVNVSTSPLPPWLWIGAGFAVVAAAAAAYVKKTRLTRIHSGFAVVPKLNLDDLRVETQGQLKSGCEISLRTVRGQSRYDIEASGSIVGGRNE